MTRNRFIYSSLLSFLGLWASFTILTEKIRILENPDYSTTCNINPLVSCGNIMQSAQASTFGFPNPILGLIGFSMILAMSIMGVLGVTFSKLIYTLANAGLVFAAGFSIYLFTQSTYVIGAICLYCVCVWFASLMLFAEFTGYNLYKITKNKRLHSISWIIGVVSFLIIIAAIYLKYEYQFRLYFFS
jgi:uncharacterized membrane protein